MEPFGKSCPSNELEKTGVNAQVNIIKKKEPSALFF
jgi:hypothetical protein